MNFYSLKVLLLEGYSRQILPYIRAYRELGCKTYVLCNSKLDLGYVSKLPYHKILGVCDMERYNESEKYICKLIAEGKFDIVIPMGDFGAKILATNKEYLSQFSKIAVNDSSTFVQALDKLNVMRVCLKENIPCPKTLMHISTISDIQMDYLIFPIVVKPRNECGARGFHCFEIKEQLIRFANENNLADYVIQEYIPQSDMNMSCGLFLDMHGNVKSSYVYVSRRWYPIKGGTGTLNQLVDRPDVVKMCSRLANIMGLYGTIGFDLIQDKRDDTAKIIEINPRVLACAKIGFDAGINQALQILELEYNQEVTEFEPIIKEDIYVRMSQIDILWFLKSPKRLSAKPSWFSHKNTRDQTFSWDDPLPWFAFLLRGLKNLKKEENKRK